MNSDDKRTQASQVHISAPESIFYKHCFLTWSKSDRNVNVGELGSRGCGGTICLHVSNCCSSSKVKWIYIGHFYVSSPCCSAPFVHVHCHCNSTWIDPNRRSSIVWKHLEIWRACELICLSPQATPLFCCLLSLTTATGVKSTPAPIQNDNQQQHTNISLYTQTRQKQA